MIRLRDITWDNLRDVLNVTIPESQKTFVQTIPTFLAQSYVNLKLGYEDISLAVYDEAALIGFVKLVYVPKNEDVYRMEMDSIMIDALIIDGAHQGKGYGEVVMDAIMDHIDTTMKRPETPVSLVIFDDNARAVRLAEGYGFSFLKKRNTKRPMTIYMREPGEGEK